MSDHRPHVVMMVGNDVTVDGRVQKTASSLVASGARVTLMDYDPKGQQAPDEVAGCVLVRPKVAIDLAGESLGGATRLRDAVRSVLSGGRFVSTSQRRRATYARKLYERGLASRIVGLKLSMQATGPWPGLLGKAWRRLRNQLLTVRVRLLRQQLQLGRSVHRYRLGGSVADRTGAQYAFASEGMDVSAADMRRDWRSTVPDAAAIELAFASVIDRLEPDAIHAHDYLLLPSGAEASRRARAAGRHVPLVYDAHEYVRGLTTYHDDRRRAIAAMEARFVPDADAIVTVSPALAEKLRVDHGLATLPTVVLNAPVASAVAAPSDGGVRGRIQGLPGGARLLVYSGNVTPARGIHTLTEALRHLPENIHLAIVTAHRVPYLQALLAAADEAGTRDRIHEVPYVAPEDVPAYLSTADVGVHPMRRYPNGDIALPNKLFEYLHARLPLVVSDCPAQATFVRDHGVGAVFRAEDPVDLAARVTEVLDDVDRFRGAYSEDLLASFSWEGQEKVLRELYRTLGVVGE